MFRTVVALAVVAAWCLPGWAQSKPVWEPVGLCGGGGLFNPSVSPHDPNTVMVESDMGGRYLSRDGGTTWRMLHHKQVSSACRGAPPLFHPTRKGVIYALVGSSARTIYVSRDDAETWTPLPQDHQPNLTNVVRRMFIDPAMPDRLFIASADGQVLFTDDEGKAWTKAEGVSGGAFAFLLERTMSLRGLYVGTSAGVFLSGDGGKTFARRSTGLPEGRPLTAFAGGSDGKRTTLYAAVPCWLEEGRLAGGVYVSTDGGAAWKRCMNPDINVQTQRTSQWAGGDLPQYSHLVCNDANPARAYLYCRGTSYFPPNHSTIYRTDDAGGKWVETFFVDPRFKQHDVALDWMTSFARQSWVSRPISMEISPTDPRFVARTDGMFMFLTRDAGRTWTCGHAVPGAQGASDRERTWKNNGLVNTTTWNYYVDPHEPNRHYIAYTDIGFARSLDRGKTWRWWGPGQKEGFSEEDVEDFPIPRAWANTCYELAFDPDIPGKIWGAFSGHHDIPNENSIWRGTGLSRLPGGICVTGDFGVTWKPLRTGLPEKPMLSIVLDPRSPKGQRTLYAAVYDRGVFKSTDDGAAWTEKSKGLGDPANLRVCRVHLHSDGTLFALVTGMRIPADGPFTDKGAGLYRSADAGETWELLNRSCPLVYPKDYAVDPGDSRVIYVGACDGPRGDPPQGGLYRTADGGKTWQRVLRKRATHFGVTFHPTRKGWIYATSTGWSDAPDGTLWLSKDSGKTWIEHAGIPFAQTHRVHFDPKDDSVIYVTTFGGSVWKGPAEP